jgi:PAS domain-containing protein
LIRRDRRSGRVAEPRHFNLPQMLECSATSPDPGVTQAAQLPSLFRSLIVPSFKGGIFNVRHSKTREDHGLSRVSRFDNPVFESVERFQLATQAAMIGTWDFYPATDDLRWDARCKALFGLSPDAHVSYDGAFLKGVHSDDRERVDQEVEVKRTLSGENGGSYEIEYRTVGIEDGIERWLFATGNAIFEHGRAVRFICRSLSALTTWLKSFGRCSMNTDVQESWVDMFCDCLRQSRVTGDARITM